FVQRVHRRDIHRGREGIVGRLTHIDVVVRTDRILRAELAAQELDGPVRDYLVDVHVGLSARTGLPYVEGVILVQLARDGLVRRTNDRLLLPSGQAASLMVDESA